MGNLARSLSIERLIISKNVVKMVHVNLPKINDHEIEHHAANI